MFKKRTLVFLVFAFALVLTACGSTKENNGSSGNAVATSSASGTGGDVGSKKPLVAYSQGDNGNSWRVTNTNDMERAAKDAGYDYVWADAKADPSKQLSDIEDLLAKKPDVLVVSPVQEEAVAPAVKLAENAGVKLITIDREIAAEIGGTYVVKLVQDWKEAGRIQGRQIVEKLTEKNGAPKGNVVEIAGTVGASPAIDNAEGIREILDEYPDIKIIDSQSGNYQRAPGRQVMDDFLQKYPKGQIDIVVTHNDEMSLGALQAIKEAGRDELVGYIASKDGFRDAIKEVIDGSFFVNVQASPYYGDVTMELVKRILDGETIDPPTHYIDFKTFDMKDNKDLTLEYYDNQVKNDLQY